MTHRAETIMAAVLTKVTNLTTTSTRVSRGRAYPVDGAAMPALTLEQGVDEVELQNIAFIDRHLSFLIIAHVKSTGTTETILNLIREEVHIALMADRAQGLTYVLDTMPLGDEAPDISGDSNQSVARVRMNWRIKYRHAVTNPGA